MSQSLISLSPSQTAKAGADLADKIFMASAPMVFIELRGDLGAGKTAFARGFINQWLKLSKELPAEAVTSPTYNLVKIYGKKRPVAHFDLYRLNSLEELEQLGFEHYFYELPCCLVEWLERIPEANDIRPKQNAFVVKIEFGDKKSERHIEISEHQAV